MSDMDTTPLSPKRLQARSGQNNSFSSIIADMLSYIPVPVERYMPFQPGDRTQEQRSAVSTVTELEPNLRGAISLRRERKK